MAETRANNSSSAIGEARKKVNEAKDLVRKHIDANSIFKPTLGSIKDIETIMTNLFQKESSLNEGHYISQWSDPLIYKHVYNSRSARRFLGVMGLPGPHYFLFDNHKEAIMPHGVGQVMGWHLVKGTYNYEPTFDKVMTVSGSPFYVTLNDILTSSGGTSGAINSKFFGTNALENGIIASMCMLHSKFPKGVLDSYTKIRVAVGRYLGDAKSADVFNTRPSEYTAEILNLNRPLTVALNTSGNGTKLVTGATSNNTGGSVGKPACVA